MLRRTRLSLMTLVLMMISLMPFQFMTHQTGAAGIVVQAGFPRKEPYGAFFSSPTVVDLNGDGKLEVLSADSTGCVWGFDRAGKLLAGFPWKTGGVCDNEPRVNASLAIGDVDGDGKLEVVAGTRGKSNSAGQRGKVFVWNHDGSLVSGWPKEMMWGGEDWSMAEVYSVALANITGDARLEVLAGTSNSGINRSSAPNLYAWSGNGTLLSGFPVGYLGAGIFSHIGAADLTGDGYAELLAPRDHMYMQAYTALGQPLSGWPNHTYLDQSKKTWGRDKYVEFTRSAPAAGDLDGDGTVEVVVAGKVRDPLQNHDQVSTALLVFEPNGTRRPGWEVGKTVGPRVSKEFTPNNAVALGDLNNDGRLEIVVAYEDGTVRAYRDNGQQLWSHNYAQGRKLFASEAVIGDVTGDGNLDVVFGTYNVENSSAFGAIGLWALDGRTGAVHSGYPLKLTDEGSSAALKGIMAAPTLADLDGDGDVEILAHSKGGTLYAWDLPVAYNAAKMPWPTGRQNIQRTGEYRKTGSMPAPTPTPGPNPTPVPSPTPVPGGSGVTSLTLINADSDQPMAGFDPLTNGATLNLRTLPSRNLNIRANTAGSIGSVAFTLDGTKRIESYAPYALAGDNGGTDYNAWTPSVGTHSLTVAAYTNSGGGGSMINSVTVQFTVLDQTAPKPTAVPTPPPSGLAVTKLVLINADSDQPIAGFDPFSNGATLKLSSLPSKSLNVHADTSGSVGSVVFTLDGSVYRIENNAIYALAGNNGSDYYSWTPKVGTHTLKVTPYAARNGAGTQGTSITITFTVTN